MARLYMLTFQGEPKDHQVHEHTHENAAIMTAPLVVLSALTLVAGFVVFEGVGKAIGLGSSFVTMIENVLEAEPEGFSFNVPMAIISTLAVVGGLAAARYYWAGEAAPAKAMGAKYPAVYKLFLNKFYLDDFYQWCINNVVLGLAKGVAYFDREVVNDTGINGPGHVAQGFAWVFKRTETGKLPNYALGMAFGVVVLAIAGLAVKG
jgi:NADH-quinone oxidoreductase subunit L